MRDDPSVTALVFRVRDGDQAAWDELIERYSPLVWSICVRYQLARPDIDDVGQNVWLLLVEQIGRLRAGRAAWLAGHHHQARMPPDSPRGTRQDHVDLPPEEQMPSDPDVTMIEQEIIVAERNAALRAAFAELPAGCHELLSMLMSDPPCAYADISATLGIPVGSIGPTRARCLQPAAPLTAPTAVLGETGRSVEVKGTGRWA